MAHITEYKDLRQTVTIPAAGTPNASAVRGFCRAIKRINDLQIGKMTKFRSSIAAFSPSGTSQGP